MAKKKPELFIYNTHTKQIVERSTDVRYIHKQARIYTFSTVHNHIVLRPVATYKVKIEKKRHT